MPASMDIRFARNGVASRLYLPLVCLFMTGCTSVFRVPPPEAEPAAVPSPPPAVETAPPAPPPASPPPPPEAAPRSGVALLYTGKAREAEIAAELAERLAKGRYLVTRVEVDADDLDAALAERPDAVVAIGPEAAARARAQLPGQPIVFCQVLDAADLLDDDPKLWGVGAEPPVELQLKAWKAAHPSLGRIGLIVSEARAGLASEAVAAAREIGAEVTVSRSGSDRETLYLFKRMAARIDGFWLFPDSEILSPTVLRELLDYALSHNVGVLGFSEALLPWGAVFSARSRTDDVVASVHGVLDRVLVGDTRALPRLTPLSEVELDFNYEAARRLGLALAPETSWVIREAD